MTTPDTPDKPDTPLSLLTNKSPLSPSTMFKIKKVELELDEHGRTPLMNAIIHNEYNDTDKTMELIEENKNNPYYFNIVDKHGNNALMYALNYNRGNFEVISPLIDKTENFNLKSNFGMTPNIKMTPLLYAIMTEQSEVAMKMLTKIKIDLSITDNEGNNALMYAITTNLTEVCKELMKHKGMISSVNNNNETPLIIACKSRNPEMALALLKLKKNINISQLDNTNHNALYYAKKYNMNNVIDAILKSRDYVAINNFNDATTNMNLLRSKSAATRVIGNRDFQNIILDKLGGRKTAKKHKKNVKKTIKRCTNNKLIK